MLNRYTVEVTLRQENIQAETAAEAIAVFESNVQAKGYVTPVKTVVERVKP